MQTQGCKMTDRELLEKAAKAAGYVLTWKTGYCKGGEFRGAFITEKDDAWNPIDDDGDAQRLSVRLRMNVFHAGVSAFAMDEDGDFECREGHEKDPGAATRRAIVRLAAELGESA
jgi:hypothetical protein